MEVILRSFCGFLWRIFSVCTPRFLTLRYFSFLCLTFTHFLGVYQPVAAGATVVAVSQVCMQIGRGEGEPIGFLLTSSLSTLRDPWTLASLCPEWNRLSKMCDIYKKTCFLSPRCRAFSCVNTDIPLRGFSCRITASRPCSCRLAGAFSTSTNRCLFVEAERLRRQSDESDPWRAHVSTLETLLTLLNKWTALMKRDSSTGFVLAGFHLQHFSTFSKCLFCFTSSRALEEEEVQAGRGAFLLLFFWKFSLGQRASV